MKPQEEMSEIEILEEEINSLKTRIRNTEYDLANSFKGNGLIQKKLEISKNNLAEKEKRIKELNSLLKGNNEFKKVEERVNEIPLSENQKEEIINEVKETML